ncbi:hypothetical protein [Enemella sp. A6]|uniref:hypothetical protein n=1 Tax=Enemella sp. A6 TaxID=3440152 RepID=UPI003EBFB025
MRNTGAEPPSVRELCELIWSLEDDLELLSWQHGRHLPWPLVRNRLLTALSERTGTQSPAHTVHRTRGAQAALVARHTGAVVTRNPMLVRGPRRDVILVHPRKTAGTEWYTEQLRRELPEALVLDSAINGIPLPSSHRLDFQISTAGMIGRLVSRVPALRRSWWGRDLARLEQVSDRIVEVTGHRVDVAALATRESVKHALLRRWTRAVFKALGTRRFFVVVGYFQQHWVGAAQDLGIEVIELQHGVISPYHLGYSYPGRPAVGQHPDQLWAFGSFWPETVDLPGGMSSRVIGAAHLPRDLPHRVERDPNLVLVLSQGTVSSRLGSWAMALRAQRPDLHVVFRLHPSERIDPARRAELEAAGLEVSDGEDPRNSTGAATTYWWQARATWQLGVSSTALFEGMALGARTVVAGLAGHEYLTEAVARGDAVLVGEPSGLAEGLDLARPCPEPDRYYALPVAKLI